MARNNILSVRPQGTARNTPTPRQVLAYPKKIATTWAFAQSELKAYYQFENGAELTDSSPNSSTLTAIAVPVQATPRWGTGCVGLGTSQAFSAEDHADFQPAGNFSVSAWVRTTKTGVNQWIMQTYSENANSAGIQLNINTGNTITVKSGKNSGTTIHTDYETYIGSVTVCDGMWHFITGTYDGIKLHVYVDGTEDGTGVAWTNAAAFAATNYVRVGARNRTGTNDLFFQGCLDEVAFFPSDALSLAQVQSLYAKSITDSSNSAIKALASAVYLFNEGGQLVDSSTGGTHTLTAIGTPTTCTPKFGGSVFLGNSSAYSVVDSAVLKPTGAFSVGGWVKMSGALSSNILTSWSQNTYRAGFKFFVDSSGKPGLQIANNTSADYGSPGSLQVAGSTSIVDNTWHFVVCTWDTANMKVYLDGISDATPVAWTTAPVYAATNYVRVGCQNNTGANAGILPGQLDDIFLLNGTALTADEVNYIYTQRLKIT